MLTEQEIAAEREKEELQAAMVMPEPQPEVVVQAPAELPQGVMSDFEREMLLKQMEEIGTRPATCAAVAFGAACCCVPCSPGARRVGSTVQGA